MFLIQLSLVSKLAVNSPTISHVCKIMLIQGYMYSDVIILSRLIKLYTLRSLEICQPNEWLCTMTVVDMLSNTQPANEKSSVCTHHQKNGSKYTLVIEGIQNRCWLSDSWDRVAWINSCSLGHVWTNVPYRYLNFSFIDNMQSGLDYC